MDSMLESFLAPFREDFVSKTINAFWDFLPIWLPILAFTLFLQTWLRYTRTRWVQEQGAALLEIRIPKEINKSPMAMEVVIGDLSQPSVGSLLDVFLKGRVRPWFSLEIASIDGQVRFFIWTFAKLKNLVEAQIYSQYPSVEIYEVPDYALLVPYDPQKFSYFGAQLKLTKPDPFPIKTYIDYGLDKDPKEEYKIDPITPVLEYLGSLKPGEQGWVQIMIRTHREEALKDARVFKKKDWKSSAKEEIKKIIEKESFIKPDENKGPTLQNLTEVQKATIDAIERSISKPAFDTVVRLMYLAKKEVFNPVNIGGILGSFKQYSSNTLNGFKPMWTTGFDYPWQDFKGVRKSKNERKILDAYKRRSFFYGPYKNFHGRPFVLTAEELATLYHFPGGVATTPSFTRIVSKKAEPPSNLPL